MKGFERDQMFLEEGKELGRRLEQENTLKEKNRADAEKHRAEEEKRRADAAVEEIEKLRCKIIKRKGSIRVICENPKHKQRQG